MAIVFLDTNIVIEYIKQRDKNIISCVESFDEVYINEIIVMELYQGARDKK